MQAPELEPLQPLPWRRWALLWLASAAILLAAKAPFLGEPHYWDAVGCYVPQAREILKHRLQLDAYRAAGMVRPPLFTGTIALVMALISPARQVLHGATVLWCAAALPGAYVLCRALGGGRWAAVLAMLLVGLSPSFFAQAHMVQTDLPAAALCGWAWALLLLGRPLGFAAVASLAILTKESSFYLCPSAGLLLMARRLSERAPGTWLQARELLPAALRAWPAALPCVVLLLWLAAHRRLTGHYVAPEHKAVLFSLASLGNAALHNFVEGGRLLLVAAAALLLVAVLHRRLPPGSRMDRLGVLFTSLAVFSLPLCFSAGLPRYMLLSLPPLCALAAVAVEQLGRTPFQRSGAAALLLTALVLSWRGESWHENGGHHLERNLDYRELLALHKEAAALIGAERPRAVLAAFPMDAVLNAPREDGYLPEPLPVYSPRGHEPLGELCRHDFFVEAAGSDVRSTRQRLEEIGALSLWRRIGAGPGTIGSHPLTPRWARKAHEIRIYRIRCHD